MTECNGMCSGCAEMGNSNCAAGNQPKASELNDIKHVIAVVSGKGGVGKSTVTAMLASGLNNKGYKVGILDADITGPSIPKLFGTKGDPQVTEFGLLPLTSDEGIEIMSINLLLENEDEPVIWRGPVISGVIKQFWEEVIWGDLDFLIVDLPPGTGDAPLTVMQALPLSGAVIVTSPQDLAVMVVKKAVKMTRKMDVPILGIIENMSYFECAECERIFHPFGEGKAEILADELEIPLLGKVPLKSEISISGDAGRSGKAADIEYIDLDILISRLS
ncbi:MAG: Mrp/NBP35 family ATP-binding protein [Dehalobacter sp. 4CP]|nr:Mrp/NBP35 family ATP-binding protein [Dehalobacter sp. 4CP]